MRTFAPMQIGILALICAVALNATEAADESDSNTLSKPTVKYSNYAKSLREQKLDLRIEFYASREEFESNKQNGLFRLVYRSFSDSMQISTNECPTVEAALHKLKGGIHDWGHQIRLIQENVITQTSAPLKTDDAATKTLLSIRPQAGDVLIVTSVE